MTAKTGILPLPFFPPPAPCIMRRANSLPPISPQRGLAAAIPIAYAAASNRTSPQGGSPSAKIPTASWGNSSVCPDWGRSI